MRTYSANKPLPLRSVPRSASPPIVNRKEATERLRETLGSEWNPSLTGLKVGSELLTTALGPGWSIYELRNIIRKETLRQGTHWFKRGRCYSVDVVAIAQWHLNQEEEG
ncbi:hypothetical protein H6F86_00555 [Phormidium sp. FACHB-592]|uniref:DNA-binding protein n=1 Tax=Stenomitos frigidus AS-A4 TaxID=2933935 RepID=A0ABV0KVU8_9CYAN|nr:hypothetical protein [Phormidium sp. FACHB-592]MBD2072425.1 hypothetical protein [Phormidium sp. FACHB-592]